MNAKRMASGISRYKALAKETHEYSVNLIHELPRDYRVVWKQAVCSEIDEKGGYAVYLLYLYKKKGTRSLRSLRSLLALLVLSRLRKLRVVPKGARSLLALLEQKYSVSVLY